MPKNERSYNYLENHVPTDDTDLLIETINSMDLGWKANKCLLQKSNAQHPGSECEESLAQKSKKAFGSSDNF